MKIGKDYTGVGVCFFCHDGNGRYIFGHRSKNCKDEHDVWDIGGGGVSFGETLEDAVRREIKEEYNAEAKQLEYLGFREVHREHGGEKTHWVAFDFKVRVEPEQVRNNEPHKLDDVRWFRLDELPDRVHSQFPTALRLYQHRL